jgi:hypothetical protein
LLWACEANGLLADDDVRQWHLRRYAAALSRHRAELMEVTMVGMGQQREVTNDLESTADELLACRGRVGAAEAKRSGRL